jgi:NAD(P)-dependent dehydrogenase (short-subunit alcohol dehydrogenase family)
MTDKGVAIITGGSRGIGAATAKLAAKAGWLVCVNYASSAEAAQAVIAEIEAAGGTAFAMKGDVASEADVVGLFAEAAKRGPITAVVNNAGILAPKSTLAEMDAKRIQRIMAVNVTGALIVAREAVRHMSKTRTGQGGSIVNVSSAAARIGSPNEFIDYAASKGAMDAMTLGLSKEVGAEGIRVNAVRPGLILTDIHADAGDPDRAHRMASGVPMQRPGTAEEVAETIVWLMGDQSSYVNGTLIDVTGGR